MAQKEAEEKENLLEVIVMAYLCQMGRKTECDGCMQCIVSGLSLYDAYDEEDEEDDDSS